MSPLSLLWWRCYCGISDAHTAVASLVVRKVNEKSVKKEKRWNEFVRSSVRYPRAEDIELHFLCVTARTLLILFIHSNAISVVVGGKARTTDANPHV